MKRYIILLFKIIGFMLIVGLIQLLCNAVFLNPLVKVPEMGDNYGLILMRPSEQFALSMLFQLLSALLVIALFRMNADRPWQFLAGPARESARQALWGTTLGTVLILSIAGLLYLSGLVGFSSTPFSSRELLWGLALMVVVAMSEEVIFRGYILQELSENMNRGTALGISAVMFSLIHFSTSNYNWISILNLFLAGLLLGLAYFRYNNIWAAVGLHFSWNFVQGPVLGFKVSGNELPMWLAPEFSSAPEYITGSIYGLEGTLIAALVQLAAVVWLYVGLSRPLHKPVAEKSYASTIEKNQNSLL